MNCAQCGPRALHDAEAAALFKQAHRFAPDRKKTLEVYARQAESDDDPKVRAMMTESVTRLSRMQ